MKIFDIEVFKTVISHIENDVHNFNKANIFMLYIKDVSGNYFYANNKFLLLHKLDDVVGKRDKDLFDDIYARYLWDKDLLTLTKEEPIISIDEFSNTDEQFHYKSIRYPIYDETNNKVSFIFFIGCQLTDYEKSREDILKTVSYLEDINKSVSMFTGQMKHELRIPLNAIIGFTYLTSESEINESQRNLLEKLLNVAKILSDMDTNDAGLKQQPSETKNSNEIDITKNTSKINSIKILLVEDNVINQQIILKILENQGAIVTIANNGLEAVDAFELDKSFDVILMDIEMPFLNGYDATREIIKKQTSSNKKVPIIGLTALNFDIEKQKCFEVGMSDVVTKPFMPHQLLNALIKNICGSDDTITEEVKKESNHDSLVSKIKNIEYKEGSVRLMGNDSLYLELLLSFKNKYEDFAINFSKLIKDGEIEQALRDLHSLKGASGNLSAKKIYENCITLKDAIDSGSTAKIFVSIQYLHDSIIELSRELESITDTNNNLEIEVVDNSIIKTKLKNLHKSVTEDIDIAVSFDYLGELKGYLYDTKYRKNYEDIKNAIDKFDLLKASKYLAELIESM